MLKEFCKIVEFLCTFNSVFHNDNILMYDNNLIILIAHYQNGDADFCIMLKTKIQTLFRFYQFIQLFVYTGRDGKIKLIPNIQSR